MTPTNWYGWGWMLIKASAVAALVFMDLGLLVAVVNVLAEAREKKEKKHERK